MGQHHYILNHEGARLCKDGMFRRVHASFGSYLTCVKVYRYLRAAQRKKYMLERRGNTVHILTLNNNQVMDAGGTVSVS